MNNVTALDLQLQLGAFAAIRVIQRIKDVQGTGLRPRCIDNSAITAPRILQTKYLIYNKQVGAVCNRRDRANRFLDPRNRGIACQRVRGDRPI